MIAFCGLDCAQCEAFQAMQRSDHHDHADIAQRWHNLRGAENTSEDTVCAGCRSDGQRVRSCALACRIRQCARHRRLASCADCRDYPCAVLREIFDIAPRARRQLERIRGSRPTGDPS
jgi:hypothetical protein